MRRHTPSLWLLIPWLALACGPGDADPVTSAEPAVPISGLYKVSGKTLTLVNGDEREIAGTVILNDTGDGAYTVTFSLQTTAPGADQAMPAEVIGTGMGSIEGRTLTGETATQLVMSTVPGIDPGFAFIPRTLSTRITSATTAEVANDGGVTIEISNEAAPGQEYMQTRTTLRGRRVSDTAISGPRTAEAPEVSYDDLEEYDPSDYVDEEFPEDDLTDEDSD